MTCDLDILLRQAATACRLGREDIAKVIVNDSINDKTFKVIYDNPHIFASCFRSLEHLLLHVQELRSYLLRYNANDDAAYVESRILLWWLLDNYSAIARLCVDESIRDKLNAPSASLASELAIRACIINGDGGSALEVLGAMDFGLSDITEWTQQVAQTNPEISHMLDMDEVAERSRFKFISLYIGAHLANNDYIAAERVLDKVIADPTPRSMLFLLNTIIESGAPWANIGKLINRIHTSEAYNWDVARRHWPLLFTTT